MRPRREMDRKRLHGDSCGGDSDDDSFLNGWHPKSVGYHYAVYSVCTSSSHLGRVGVQFVKLLHQ